MQLPLSIIITFISLIYGLALAHALSCIAEHIQHREKVKQYWVWWLWAIVLLLLSIGFWTSIYMTWKDVEIPMKGFVAIVLQSSLFYLTIYMFFNHINEMEKKDLEYEYYKYKKLFFLILLIQYSILFIVFDLIKHNLSLYDIVIFSLKNTPPLKYILNPYVILISLAFINNKKFHSLIAVLVIFTAIMEFLSG